MSYKVALNFEDGVTQFVDCLPGENVADAAYRVGVNVPLDCRDGACGTCKCSWESGKFEMEGYVEDALSDEEVQDGMVLTCCMQPESDCVINVPALSDACLKNKQADIETTISAINKLSETTLSFTVKGDQVGSLSFLPGQYMNVQVPGTEETRAYSFSSLVKDDAVSFLIRIVPDGLMSGYLNEQAKEGDALTLKGPYGTFYLRDINRPVLMLAGGTGLAPFTAMLEKIARDGTDHPIHLIYGVTNDVDLVGLNELEKFAEQIPEFTFTTCVASEESKWPQKGYVTRYIEPQHLNEGDVDVYLCGPPPMVEAVSSFMRDEQITPKSFYYEKFSSSQ